MSVCAGLHAPSCNQVLTLQGAACVLPHAQVDKADLCKLCVHKLPPPSSSGSGSSSSPDGVGAAVKAALAAASREAGHEDAAAAVEAALVEQPGDSSKQLLFLVFKHAGVANKVFAALPGICEASWG